MPNQSIHRFISAVVHLLRRRVGRLHQVDGGCGRGRGISRRDCAHVGHSSRGSGRSRAGSGDLFVAKNEKPTHRNAAGIAQIRAMQTRFVRNGTSKVFPRYEVAWPGPVAGRTARRRRAAS